jgi:hypothetical protein
LELRDIIVTPLLLLMVYAAAYAIRSRVTDEVNRKFFLPALTLRIFCAIALGFLYQFYYGGGDTFNYHTHGSRHVWNAFMENPEAGFKLLFSDNKSQTGIYKYSSHIPFFRDKSAYMVVRVAAIFDLFTFSSYTATAICFAVLSFTGSWLIFLTFYRDYPHLYKTIALASLFIPSVAFWGSGVLKDTLTLAAVGVATFYVRQVFIRHRINILQVVLIFLAFYLIFHIKKYVILCLLPAIFLWVYASMLKKFRSVVLKLLILPFVIGFALVCGYIATEQLARDDPRYALSQLGNTAKITAYDIAFQTGRDAGSTYSLGELDGSFSSMLKLAPQAVNVSLFRPYLWEVKNPLQLLGGLESFLLFIFTIYLLYRSWGFLGRAIINPDVMFCLVFSITFAFAVGVSTFNFGTLSRYKIPLMPFFVIGLALLNDYAKRERKLSALDRTE